MQYYNGIPERIINANPQLQGNYSLVVAHESDHSIEITQEDHDILEGVKNVFGPPGTNPADYLYIYQEDPYDDEEDGEAEQQEELTAGDQVKKETADAYNKVGNTAHLKGNIKKAKAVMTYLGYNEKEFEIAGEDAFNYQGVGNPHNFANIQAGEKVLDIGSGLGVDSFIAATLAGKEGRVIGIDIAKAEVAHAQKRADARGLDIKFVEMDMENIQLPDGMIDVVISNGAFCLAPNKE
jgi:hypothetical protein